jgi:hypothetical protein
MQNKIRARQIRRRIFAGALVIFLGLQCFNPSLTNPPPAEVAALLRSACYDCHSQETRWPWYAHVAPVSWWIVRHLKEGRDELNFSEWPHADAYLAGEELGHIGEQVQSRQMPLPSYTWLGLHPEARLTLAQRGQILKWTEQAIQGLPAEGGK